MHIWELTVEVEWSYHDEGDTLDIENYIVSAEDYLEALAKVKKIALNKNRAFVDDLGEGKKKYKPQKIIDLVKLERTNLIDG